MKSALKDHGPLLSMIGALLEYPEAFLQESLPEIRTTVSRHPSLPQAARSALLMLVDYLGRHTLLELQEGYVDVFDRGRATSLYLFEHVHGESRDRGQAMVDLLDMYEKKGMYLATGELPDYLPVFLEFLAHESSEKARSLLGEIADIAQSIAEKLAARGTPYYAAVAALLPLAGEPALQIDFHMAARLEDDIDKEALDQAWQDQPVNFLNAGNPAAMQPQPVHFYDKRPPR